MAAPPPGGPTVMAGEPCGVVPVKVTARIATAAVMAATEPVAAVIRIRRRRRRRLMTGRPGGGASRTGRSSVSNASRRSSSSIAYPLMVLLKFAFQAPPPRGQARLHGADADVPVVRDALHRQVG